MNQVNFVNKTGNSYTPKFKHKHENSTVSTKPINTNNSTMNGLDATASYNFAIVNKIYNIIIELCCPNNCKHFLHFYKETIP